MDKSSDIYRLAWALCNIMDGMKGHDIAGETGLPEEECKRIDEIRKEALAIVNSQDWSAPTRAPIQVGQTVKIISADTSSQFKFVGKRGIVEHVQRGASGQIAVFVHVNGVKYDKGEYGEVFFPEELEIVG